VCKELRKLAAQRLNGERAGQTLQPTALVHEVYLRLVGKELTFDGPRHFLFAAARASVRYATADGSATTAAGDYTAASGLVSFANGETRKTVTVTVNGDRLGEAEESFLLNLSNGTGAAIADGQGRAALLDDEPRIHINSVVILAEGNEKSTLVLSASLTALSTQTVTVNYATADGTAIAKEDYVAAQGVLTYAPGETLKRIVIEMPKAKKAEDIVEAFVVELANASANAAIFKRGVVHVVDDDVPSGNSAATAATASRTGAATRPATLWSALPVSGLAYDQRPFNDVENLTFV
jgi:hypothetical protein